MEKSSSRTKKTTPKKVTKKVASKKAVKKVAHKKTAIKKAAAKKTTQKTTTKKAVKKVTKKVPLVAAPVEKHFWTNDGQVLADLVSLAESFAAMDDMLFTYHANETKNDFADWVEHVLGDVVCAQSLRRASTPKQAHGAVVRRLRVYHW